MKMICEFNGVRTSSFGLVTGDLQVEALKIGATVAKFGFEGAARNSPGWGYTPCRPQSGDKSLSRDCATCGLSRSWRNANAADDLARSPGPRGCVVYRDAAGPLHRAARALRGLHSGRPRQAPRLH